MRSPLSALEPVAPYGWPLVRFAGGILLATHGFAKVFGGGIGKFAEGLANMGVPAPDESVSADVTRRELHAILDEALSRLQARDREIIAYSRAGHIRVIRC